MNVIQSNQALLDGLSSTDRGVREKTASKVGTYLKLAARDDGILRSIMEPEKITPAQLDRQSDTVKPVRVRDVEPFSPPAYSVPFAATPMNHYINAPRYRIMFDRVMSRRMYADVANLMTFDINLKQVVNDFLLKDVLDEEDRKLMGVVNTVVGPLNEPSAAANPRVDEVAAMGNVTVGPMSRESLALSQTGLPSTNRSLNHASALVNNITIWGVVALAREQIGGDLAENLFRHGFAEREIMGTRWLITIKKNLVPKRVIYYFAAPEYIGDFNVLEDLTVSSKYENFMLMMFCYEMIGGTVKNSGAVCRAVFTNPAIEWDEVTA